MTDKQHLLFLKKEITEQVRMYHEGLTSRVTQSLLRR